MTLEADLVEALRDPVLERLRPGHDASAVLREAAEAARFALARSGALEGLGFPVELAPPRLPVRVHDLRDQAPRAIPRSRIRGGKTTMRDPSTVTAVVLHQTAVRDFGPAPADLRRAKGDRTLASVYRVARTVPAHVVGLRSGDVVLGRPMRAYLYHAGKASGFSLGLELEGLYSGLLDDPDTIPDEAKQTTWKGEPMELDDLTAAVAVASLRKVVELGRAEGMPLERVLAHRQSSSSRRSDPGEAVWKLLEPVARELGLDPDPDWTIADGRPIPEAWGGSAGVPYF